MQRLKARRFYLATGRQVAITHLPYSERPFT